MKFHPVYLFLALPYAAFLWVPFYNRIEPQLFGIPFFYWWQIFGIVLTVALHRAGLFLAAERAGQMTPITVTIIVFLALFVFVALLGLFGSRWRAGDLSQLHEWGLGGRSFGTLITWFLLGGDLYTAYTFIAVPALMFGAGATGFFAVPYAA